MAETTHTGKTCELTKMAALELSSAGRATPPNEGKEISPPIDDLAREEAAAFVADDEVRAQPVLSTARKVLLGAVMMCTYFLSSATVSSSLLIIPSLAADLQLSELAAQWVASAFTLANGCGLLVAGRLADIFGRKYLFLAGITVNGLASIGSGFIRSHVALCVIRAVAGLGLALAMPSAFGIVGVTFIGHKERTIAFAVMGMGHPLGGSLGQVFGGLIAGSGGKAWSYQFFLLAGLAFAVCIAGLFAIPATRLQSDRADRRIDYVGTVAITVALSAFSFALTQGGLVDDGWEEPYIPALFSVSLLLVGGFGLYEVWLERRHSTPPLIKMSILRRHDWLVLYVVLMALSAYTAISGWVYLTTIWYQTYKEESPIQNVLHVLPAPIMGIFVCLLVPYLAPRVRAPIILCIGGFCTAAACWLYAVQPEGTNYWACEFIANLVNPFGADFTMGVGSILISNLAEGHEQSLLGAVFQTSLQLSGTIGVCLSSLVQETVYERTGDLHYALCVAWWMLAGFSWLACVVVICTPMRRVGLAKDVGARL